MDRTVRNFKLVEPIGTGGMGTIYRAVQVTLDRAVAIKELHPHLARDPDFIARFEREAKSAAGLQHENIVGVIDFGQEGESYFLALEFVDGPDLKGVMTPDPKVVVPVAIQVTLDVLRGLGHAHGRGVVHRDIKPANVMVAKDGIAKVADFSIARATSLPSMTATGDTIGTPAYMSPEQAGGEPLDGRSDLFSAAIILYEMLAGMRPFAGDAFPAIFAKLLTTRPRDLFEINPFVPNSVARIVAKALERNRDRRFPTAEEFADTLDKAARAAEIPLGRHLVAEYVKKPRVIHPSIEEWQEKILKRGRPTMTLWTRGGRAKQLAGKRRNALLFGLPFLAIGAVSAGVAWSKYSGRGEGQATPAPTPAIAIATAPIAAATPAETAEGVIATPAAGATATPGARPVKTKTLASSKTPAPRKTPAPVATVDDTMVLDPDAGQVGFLKVDVKPWADVFVDGKLVDRTPIALPLKLEPGPHELTYVGAPEYEAFVETVQIVLGRKAERKIILLRKKEAAASPAPKETVTP